jgi:hypothetical protein
MEAQLVSDSGPLPWRWANGVLESIGRRPILMGWIALNLIVFTWWGAVAPVTDAERADHDLTFLAIITFLDWPGTWIASIWLVVLDSLAAMWHGRDRWPFVFGARGLVILWLASAASAWAFWRFIATPMARSVDRWVDSRRDPYRR